MAKPSFLVFFISTLVVLLNYYLVVFLDLKPSSLLVYAQARAYQLRFYAQVWAFAKLWIRSWYRHLLDCERLIWRLHPRSQQSRASFSKVEFSCFEFPAQVWPLFLWPHSAQRVLSYLFAVRALFFAYFSRSDRLRGIWVDWKPGEAFRTPYDLCYCVIDRIYPPHFTFLAIYCQHLTFWFEV